MEGIAQQVKNAKPDNARWKTTWAPYANSLYPLTNTISKNNITKRKQVKVLGKGAYGRVNLEKLKISQKDKEAIVATKYFTDVENFGQNVNEIAILKYLKGQPNIAQFIGFAKSEATPNQGFFGAMFQSSSPKPLTFPAVLMAVADKPLSDKSVFTSWADIYSTVKGVLRGYNILHKRGIVHRDTKPDNMLMTKTGEPWITDFGCARYISPTIPVPDDNFTGTPIWSSPEILMKSALKKKKSMTYDGWFASDAWAVGMSLIHFVTGDATPPYQQLSEAEKQHLNISNVEKSLIKSILNKCGEPTEEDGEIYSLYKNFTDIIISPNNKTPPKNFAIANSKFPNGERDEDQFNKVCAIIEGLTTYNTKTRWTIEDALKSLNENTEVAPMPLISAPYEKPPQITDIILEKLLYNMSVRLHLKAVPRYVILDRAYTYILSYISQMRIDPKDVLNNWGASALCIADGLFNELYGNVAYENENKFKITQIITTCPLLGRTWFDEMCEQAPEKFQELGYLNVLCFQKMLYNKYSVKIPELQKVLITLARNDEQQTATKDMDPLSKSKHFTELINDAMNKVNGGKKTRNRRYKATTRKTRRYNVRRI